MSSGISLTQEQIRDAYNVSPDSLAARCGVDTKGPLEDDSRSESERMEACKMQVRAILPNHSDVTSFVYIVGRFATHASSTGRQDILVCRTGHFFFPNSTLSVHISSELAAKYLPALTIAYERADAMANAAMLLINIISHTFVASESISVL
jgi:hypothetical protein